MLTWTFASVRHHKLLFFGSFVTLLIGSSIVGACLQLMVTAFSAPDGGFDVLVTGSGTMDGNGERTTATEHFSPLGSAREDLLSVAGTVGTVCLFLTATTLSMTVAYLVVARVREFGSLRLLGATSSVLRRVLAAEVLALCLVASLAGAIISVLLTPTLQGVLTSAGYVSTTHPYTPSTLGVLLTMAVTALVTLLGTRSGSRRALDILAIHASRGNLPRRRLGARRWIVAAAGLVWSLAFALIAAGSSGDGVVGLGLMLPMMMGGSLALVGPVLVPAAVGLLSHTIERLAPGPSLAFAAASTRLSRDATPAVALPALLFIGIAGSVSTTLASDARAVAASTQSQVRADVVATGLTPAFTPQAARAAGATAVDAPLSATFIATDRDTALELSAEGVDPAILPRTRGIRTWRGDLSKLARGGIAVSRQEASDDGYRVGQTLTFVTSDRKRHALPIVAVVEGSPDLVAQLMVSRAWMSRNVPDAAASRAFLLGAHPVELARRVSATPGVGTAAVTLQWAQAASRDHVANSVRGVAVVLAPAALFCMLAVGNAVLMWLSTRSAEVEALGRVGMTWVQRRNTLLWWAGIVAGVGVLLGTLIIWTTDVVVRIGLFGSPFAQLSSFPFPIWVAAALLVLISASAPVLWLTWRGPGRVPGLLGYRRP